MKVKNLFKFVLLATMLVTQLPYKTLAEDVESDVHETEIPEYVYPPDGRKIVSNRTALPYRCVVGITFEGYVNGSGYVKYTGSGVLIQPDLVLTAAHNLYDVDMKRYYQNVVVTPAATWNGQSFSGPYGSVAALETEVLENYKPNNDDYDIGLIKLISPIGNKTGYLSYVTNSINPGDTIKSIGYPGDMNNSMIEVSDRVNSADSLNFWSNIDDYYGQSGSPVLNSSNQVVGVLSREDYINNTNKGVILTQDLLNLITSINSYTGTVYRMYNPNSTLHHFTSSGAEVNTLTSAGWKYEGVAWKSGSRSAVYRLYNSKTGQHFFTANSSERDRYVSSGWKNEGVAFYAGDNLDVIRLYNPNNGDNLYTVDYIERVALVNAGWVDYGAAFRTR